MPGIYPCGGDFDEFSCGFHPEYAEYRVVRNQLNGVYNWLLDNRRSFLLNQIGTPDFTTGFMLLAALTSGHLEFHPGQELEFTIVLE